MFDLIFKYRTTVSPGIDIVTGIFFILQQWRPHEQSLVAVQKWVFNLHKKKTRTSVVTDIIKGSSSVIKNYTAVETWVPWLHKPEIFLILRRQISLIMFRSSGPCFNFGAFVLLTFLWCSLSHKAFFLYERVKKTDSCCGMIKGSAVKNLMSCS